MTTTSNKPFNKALEVHYHPFLHGKGITEETAQRFGVGYCKKGTMKGRIVFPLHNPRGQLVGYIGRSVKPDAKAKWFFLKRFVNPALELFNLHRLVGRFRVVYLCSNPFRVLSLYQEGTENTLSMTGPQLSQAQAALLRASFQEVYLKASPGLEKQVNRTLRNAGVRVYL